MFMIRAAQVLGKESRFTPALEGLDCSQSGIVKRLPRIEQSMDIDSCKSVSVWLAFYFLVIQQIYQKIAIDEQMKKPVKQ